ncbi:MAG: response regulator [Candidatus Hydrogenedentes bacterium]|nr:response regulator [Candidatus Hydrogenedentota bacterium]
MTALKHATILVVDDEPDLCDMLAFEFRLQGSRVLSANDGDGAFKLVQSQRVDAVVTDIQMARGTGLELLDRIRARHASEPPVVFITAYDTALSPIEAYDRGAEGYFGKPFRLKDLIDCVQRVLTAPSVRWQHPPLNQPEVCIARQWPSLQAAGNQRAVAFGRGGFALSLDGNPPAGQIEPGQPIAIDIKFQSGPIKAIEGAGAVRWLVEGRNSRATCGIEFDYLEEACRNEILDWLTTNPCRPFIPRLA